MKINILGTEYNLTESNENNDSKLVGRDGYCDTSSKECVIDDMTHYSPSDAKRNLPEYKKSVKRHELIHAFLYESGLDCCCTWANDEQMVDWLAIQFPKILQVFKDADCL